MIILMAGLPGTGKSALARELAARTGGRVISKDEVRHTIFQSDEIEYSSRQDDLCLGIMLQVAEFLFEQDRDRKVFLDGRPFSRRYQIENVLTAADRLHQSWRILECVCSEETACARLRKDADQQSHSARNRDEQLYAEVQSRFEAITYPKTVIDTDQPLEASVERALAAIRAH